jgi:proteasome activator subunit 4
LVVFFYRNFLALSPEVISSVMDVLLECLADENVEVREMAAKVFSGVIRSSQRQSIVPLKVAQSMQKKLYIKLMSLLRTGL